MSNKLEIGNYNLEIMLRMLVGAGGFEPPTPTL